MGFYIRKSISVGPFRFNLSNSGVGLSAGVKGFRIGSGPRGNYVHIGRGGLYYRSTLGGVYASRSGTKPSINQTPERNQPVLSTETLQDVETGDVLNMRPTNGSDIVEQINAKMQQLSLWPWVFMLGVMFSVMIISGKPTGNPFGFFFFLFTLLITAILARYDHLRKTVVIMYDLEDGAIGPFKNFIEEFDKLSTSENIWNVDTAGRTSDWKRNAGASHLVTRKSARLIYSVPRVLKTNIAVPAIIGGRQNIHFFPDVALVVQGKRVGAVSYDELNVLWSTSTFIEAESVPSDAQIIGYTWRYVNKKGGPDRRFNNNRQIPKVLYQEMGLQSPDGLQKILQFSRLQDHGAFDGALAGLRNMIFDLKQLAIEAPQLNETETPVAVPFIDLAVATKQNVNNVRLDKFATYSEEAQRLAIDQSNFWEYRLTIELLRTRLGPVIFRWKELQNGQYTKTLTPVPMGQMPDWCKGHLDELQDITSGITNIMNERLSAAWGLPGQPGDAEQIRQACEAFTDCAQRALHWEEAIRFASVSPYFKDVRELLIGIAGRVLIQMERVYEELSRIFLQDEPSGTFNISLTVDLPDGWATRFNAAMDKAITSVRR